MKGRQMITGILDTFSEIASELVPRKSFAQRAEELGTKVVYYPRLGLPRKYVYGKHPDEPYLPDTRKTEVPLRTYRTIEDRLKDPLIREHIAICSREKGSGGDLCEMCRKLSNPKRFDFLVRLYKDRREMEFAGLNVGDAQDGSELLQPATSQYLRQLADLGLVRRQRHGRLVHYYPDLSSASPCVKEVAGLMRARLLSGSKDSSYTEVFPALTSTFRSAVVRYIAAGGDGRVEALAALYGKRPSEIIRLLEPAVTGLLLELDSEDENGTYRYIPPEDAIARRIVELS